MFKLIIIGWLVSFLLTPVFFANALSPIDNPTCFVEGEIISINFAKAEDHSLYKYDDKGNMIAYAPGPQYPDRFVLHVLVSKTELILEKSDNFNTCEELYPLGEKSKIYIPAKDIENEMDIISSFIKGEAHKPFAYAYFREYSISPAEKPSAKPPISPSMDDPEDGPEKESPTTDKILEKEEISEKLLQEKYLDSIKIISLREDRQSYNVQGIKKGKLFFFIPINLNAQFEIDAITGTIKEIKMPWWFFFVW